MERGERNSAPATLKVTCRRRWRLRKRLENWDGRKKEDSSLLWYNTLFCRQVYFQTGWNLLLTYNTGKRIICVLLKLAFRNISIELQEWRYPSPAAVAVELLSVFSPANRGFRVAARCFARKHYRLARGRILVLRYLAKILFHICGKEIGTFLKKILTLWLFHV